MKVLAWLLFPAVAAGCSPKTLDTMALQDPASCESCHPNQVKEWSGSMHAYAADDPVFVAMNARGQREAQLGPFCVRCHAPMAVLTGATQDGLNLQDLPRSLRGVTCYFCHQVDSVDGSHNNPLHLAQDGVLRGGISNPVDNPAHHSAYSTLHDRETSASSTLCGSCHDIVTPAPGNVHLERTFLEWQGSVFASTDARQRQSCGKCHMEGREGLAAEGPGVFLRRVHDHAMAGVDVALTPFPEMESQRSAIQRQLDPSLAAQLCVNFSPSGTVVSVTLDNVGGGHGWPSGANQDRRAWVELVAYAGNSVVFQSGVVDDATAVTAAPDPSLWLLRDRIFDAQNNEVHMFWQAARFESEQLAPAVTNDPRDARFFHAVTRNYALPLGVTPDRVTLRVRIRPIDHDLLEDLTQSGDLSASLHSEVPTFTVAGTTLEWLSTSGDCVPQRL